VGDAIMLARTTLTTIRVNLAWAFGYNVLAIPLAAIGYLNPLFAGVAMAASSVLVVSNSLRLRNFRGRPHVDLGLILGSDSDGDSDGGSSGDGPTATARSRRPSRLST
jgi:Kef-type K+ transport system membrane component KefB